MPISLTHACSTDLTDTLAFEIGEMSDFVGISVQALAGQLIIGLINGGFYALLSLGLAVIFGLLGIINFAHGAMYMMGAFCAWLLLNYLGLGYWYSLILSPLIVGMIGLALERFLLRRIYRLDPLYGLLLTFGLALIIEGLFRQPYGTAGQPYDVPTELVGGQLVGGIYIPIYRVWVIASSLMLCVGTALLIEKTKLGSYLRAATENPMLVRAFGIDVPRMVMLVFGAGTALAAVGGVIAAPIYQVSPIMGSNIIVTVFAVVVIGGMGSIAGAIIGGFGLGLLEGLTKAFYPEASNVAIFVVMTLVLLVRPAGLFGRGGPRQAASSTHAAASAVIRTHAGRVGRAIGAVLLAVAVSVPFLDIYPGFFMKAMCFGLFASAFGLLIGYAGLLSFGHAAFFGGGAYAAGYAMKAWGVTPELGLLCGAGFAAVMGSAFGWLAIRRHGIYFAMVTLALSQLVYFLFLHSPITGGEDGLRAIPLRPLFGIVPLDNPVTLYFLILCVLLFGLAVIHRTIHSPFGNVLKAIRDNEPRAISLGFRTRRVKLIAFVISAALSGLAGAAKVLVFPIASLTDVHWSMSGEVILMTLVGGIGTATGPLVGAFVLTLIEGYLSDFGAWFGFLQGVIFVTCVLAFRGGIVGALENLYTRSGRIRATEPSSVPRTGMTLAEDTPKVRAWQARG